MKTVRYGFPSNPRRASQFGQPKYTCKCGCGLPVWAQGSFRAGHSVQKRMKALKRTRLPLGKSKRKPVKKHTEKRSYGGYGAVRF